MDTIKAVLSKIRTLFLIFKKPWGGSPLCPSCVPVSVAAYASISPNIFENARINCSDSAKALNMLDHLTGSTGF